MLVFAFLKNFTPENNHDPTRALISGRNHRCFFACGDISRQINPA